MGGGNRVARTLATLLRNLWIVWHHDRGVATLLRRLEQHRRARAELRKERRLLGLGGRERAHLDMAEAADLVRNGGQRDREMVVLRREPLENLAEHRLVVGNQRALGAALLRIAERIEGGAAQALELR